MNQTLTQYVNKVEIIACNARNATMRSYRNLKKIVIAFVNLTPGLSNIYDVVRYNFVRISCLSDITCTLFFLLCVFTSEHFFEHSLFK